MTNRRNRIVQVLVLSALAGGAAADESSSVPPAPTGGGLRDTSVDWSQTHLTRGPALQERFNRTRTFLDEKAIKVNGQVSRLKLDGALGRRTATKIRSALDKARTLLSSIEEDLRGKEQVDGWTAHMYAYDLGMAADTLSGQARKIETNLRSAIGAGDAPRGGLSPELEEQQRLAGTLMNAAGLLRETAGAITENLK